MSESLATFPERRRTPRTKVAEIAYFSMGPENGGVVLDVSDGGLAFRAVVPVQTAVSIHFHLSLRGHSRMDGVGDVMWTNETRNVCGLKFTSLSRGAREKLGNWINQPQMPVAARTGAISRIPQIKSPISPSGPAVTNGKRVSAVSRPAASYLSVPRLSISPLSIPKTRSIWRESSFLWIMSGILGAALLSMVFLHGVRVAKSRMVPAAESSVDSSGNSSLNSGPQASPPILNPSLPSSVSDSPRANGAAAQSPETDDASGTALQRAAAGQSELVAARAYLRRTDDSGGKG
jgi:hypothetical protein